MTSLLEGGSYPTYNAYLEEALREEACRLEWESESRTQAFSKVAEGIVAVINDRDPAVSQALKARYTIRGGYFFPLSPDKLLDRSTALAIPLVSTHLA
jgi:hypothetical protein